jgi:hypothetical protein
LAAIFILGEWLFWWLLAKNNFVDEGKSPAPPAPAISEGKTPGARSRGNQVCQRCCAAPGVCRVPRPCRALEKVARGLNDAAAEQARLRGVTREIADYAATQMKGTIEEAGVTTRQLLEDVQASLHDSIAGEAILKCYREETRQQFAAVIRKER